MNKQQIQNRLKTFQFGSGRQWLWLGFGLLLVVAALAINNASRPAPTAKNAASPIGMAQSVPEAAAQGVADYIAAHSDSSAQTVPDASAQSVANYLQAHGVPFAQTVPEASVQSVTDYLRIHNTGNFISQSVPEAAVQSVTDYIRLHANDMSTALITDPAATSEMDYLKAHGVQP